MMTDRKKKLVDVLTAFRIDNAADVVTVAARHTGCDLSTYIALLENESGGRNVFGGEGTACPRAWYEGEVTRFRYTVYKVRRNLGFSPNGVGPCQLTDPDLQKQAERLGGCWKPLHNMEVGFTLLEQLVREHGLLEGARRYNGSGSAAVEYAHRLVERRSVWTSRLRDYGLLGIPRA